MQKILLFYLGVSLFGCVGYKEPLCHERNRKDVMNFEGLFGATYNWINGGRAEVIRMKITVARKDRGLYTVYSDDQTSDVFTCEIGSHLYLESRDRNLSNGGIAAHQLFQLDSTRQGSFDLVPMGTDSETLRARGIPFEIVPSDSSGGRGIDGEAANYILIDNKGLEAEDFLQLMDPLSIKLTWTALPAGS